jgi:F-type H+-transporting ATPase subunit delta
MVSSGVAKRYAAAVFELAEEAGSHDIWLANLETLAATANDPTGQAFFANPSIPIAEKQKTIAQLLPGPEQQQARNLINILVTRQRFESIPAILAEYNDLVLQARGVVVADVTTAVELSTEERERVAEGLRRMVGRTVEMHTTVDPAIIGGLIIRVGDQLIDSSVAARLDALRTTLAR